MVTDEDVDHDVIVVGGGPTGCAVGLFTARYGLDTLVFDRGRSSIQRCAFLENYLGFPAGIDVETFYDLLHDHAETAGCELRQELVESVEERDGNAGFVVETQDDRPVTGCNVVAATRYDGEYLRGLDADEAMFDTHEHHGETHDHFDREYADRDGATPVDGLYVASPAEETDRQAVVAAGRGARVGIRVVEDERRRRGYPETMVDYYDWVRRDAERSEEWEGRDRWRTWFDERLPADHDLADDEVAALREREIDRRLDSYVSAANIEARAERGQYRLLEHVDDDLVLERARVIADGRSGDGLDPT